MLEDRRYPMRQSVIFEHMGQDVNLPDGLTSTVARLSLLIPIAAGVTS